MAKKSIRPRTQSQSKYLEKIRNNTVTFGLGPAGTGKTFLAVVSALVALKEGQVDSIVITRPLVSAGAPIGHLPGTLEEKADPYLRPIFDAIDEYMGPGHLAHLQKNRHLEIAPLNYMRGRNLSGYVIADEMQNATKEEMKMLLTRIAGDDVKLVISGDPDQCDLKNKRNSGLDWAAECLCNVKNIDVQYFTEDDVVRHPLITDILKALK